MEITRRLWQPPDHVISNETKRAFISSVLKAEVLELVYFSDDNRAVKNHREKTYLTLPYSTTTRMLINTFLIGRGVLNKAGKSQILFDLDTVSEATAWFLVLPYKSTE